MNQLQRAYFIPLRKGWKKRLSDTSDKNIPLNIKACKKLLNNYSDSSTNGLINCPLCDYLESNCYKCAWVIFTNRRCSEYKKYFSGRYIKDLRQNKPKDWVKLRKAQLKKWVTLLEEYFKEINDEGDPDPSTD